MINAKLFQLQSSLTRRPALPALLFFALLTALLLAPLLSRLTTHLPGGGDVYEYVWKLWWFKHTLLTGQSPWLVPHIYYPFGFPLAYGETTTANTILALPLTLWLGEAPAYNLLLFFNRALAGWSMFLLARLITGHSGAGLLAGLIFALAPFNYIHLVHLPLTATGWLPLTFYFLERLARTPTNRLGLAAGIAFALNALTSWYFAIIAGLFGAIWGLVRLRPWRAYLINRQFWLALSIFAAAAIVLITPAALPYLAVLRSDDTTIPLANSNFFSTSPTDYLLPSPAQFLWGNWVMTRLMSRPAAPEFVVGVGFIALLFAGYGLVNGPRQSIRPWLAVTLTAVILSMGLTLLLAGWQIAIPAPPAAIESVNGLLNTISTGYSLSPEPFTISRDDGLVVPLPALLLRWFAPVLGKMRAWTRLGVMALLGISMLAAIGAAAWHRRELTTPRRQVIGWAVVLGLTLFELWWLPLQPVPVKLSRPVDSWLAGQPAGAIIEYPWPGGFSPEQMNYARVHGHPIVHAYTTYFPFVFSRRHPEVMFDFPAPAALRTLTGWQVRYVLIDTAPPTTADAERLLADIARTPCLRPLTVQDTIHVFELVNCGKERP
jgi:hypothetical protein